MHFGIWRHRASAKPGILGGPCAHCGATESPQWRRPLTKKVVLCNACGIYYSRHHSLPKRKKVCSVRIPGRPCLQLAGQAISDTLRAPVGIAVV